MPDTIILVRRYLKDRSVSDYTYSEHADGYDTALFDIAEQLDAAHIPYEVRSAKAEELPDA